VQDEKEKLTIEEMNAYDMHIDVSEKARSMRAADI
jgi:hypothetical protein